MTATGEKSEFLWTMPCYALGINFGVDDVTGEGFFDDSTKFIAPQIGPSATQCIALFTDKDLAEEFREQSPLAQELRMCRFTEVEALISFLERAQSMYRFVAVDPYRNAGGRRLVQIEELIAGLGRALPNIEG